MKACFAGAVVTIVGLTGMLGGAVAQGYPPYAPPGGYRGPNLFQRAMEIALARRG